MSILMSTKYMNYHINQVDTNSILLGFDFRNKIGLIKSITVELFTSILQLLTSILSIILVIVWLPVYCTYKTIRYFIRNFKIKRNQQYIQLVEKYDKIQENNF